VTAKSELFGCFERISRIADLAKLSLTFDADNLGLYIDEHRQIYRQDSLAPRHSPAKVSAASIHVGE
jgi:hypothetical protein